MEEMIKYKMSKGKWKEVLEEDLKINCRNYNFAGKVCKYLSMLKKINYSFYKEYTSFLVTPIEFSLANLPS